MKPERFERRAPPDVEGDDRKMENDYVKDTKNDPELKYPIKGALSQLSTKVNPLGLVEHYLWGFEGWSEPRVLISEETYQRIRSFLLEGTDDILSDIEGWMADEGDTIPFGTRVGVTLFMENRHDDESAWFFGIWRPDDPPAA